MTLLRELCPTVSATDPLPLDKERYDPQDIVPPQQKFARDAIVQLFTWLRNDGVNNPEYLTSGAYQEPLAWLTANTAALEEEIQRQFAGVTYDHTDHDATQFYSIFGENKPNTDTVASSNRYASAEMAVAGIEEVIEASRKHQPFVGDAAKSNDLAREDIIKGISAQVVRLYYLSNFANIHPSALPESALTLYANVYRQNTISDMRRAAMLQTPHTEITSDRQPSHTVAA